LCENDGEPLLQRDDDKEAVIRRRFIEFDLACAPLVEHYSTRNPRDYHLIDGDREPDAIASDLLRIIGRRQARAAA
jgi:adenylate kinase family enzyme